MSRAKAPEKRTGKANPYTPAPIVNASSLTPEPPETLDDRGVEVWNEVWQAGASFYSPTTDGFVIERYASLTSRREKLLAEIEREGFTELGSQGQTVLSPLVRVVQDIEGKLVSLEDRLGLNPEARIRLGMAVVAAKSKLEAFLDDDQ